MVVMVYVRWSLGAVTMATITRRLCTAGVQAELSTSGDSTHWRDDLPKLPYTNTGI